MTAAAIAITAATTSPTKNTSPGLMSVIDHHAPDRFPYAVELARPDEMRLAAVALRLDVRGDES